MREPGEPLYLAIDQGGHASRALVFDAAGELRASAEREIDTCRSGDDRVEHDAEQLLNSVRSAIDAVAAQVKSGKGKLVAAGLATQRATIVCWDRETGKPLSPVISWQDRRAADFVDQLRGREEANVAATGLVLSPHYGASKFRWCLDHLPAVRSALAGGCLAWGPLSSYLLYALLDERPYEVDPVSASRTLLWDLDRRDWSPPLLDLFGLPEGVLPHCVNNRHAYGTLMTPSGAVAVTVCTGDQSAALFSGGVPRADDIHINMGTGVFIQRIMTGERVRCPGLLSSLVWQDRERVVHSVEGTINGAGSALSAVEQLLGVSPRRAEREAAHWLEQEQSPPIFLNGISGLGSPYWRAGFESEFVGEGDNAARIVAVFESIVFLVMENLDRMQLRLPLARSIIATGGLSNLDGLMQRLANLGALPVYRPRQCEATGRGLARLVTGWPEDSENQSSGTHWQPRRDPALEDRYRRWKTCMKQVLS